MPRTIPQIEAVGLTHDLLRKAFTRERRISFPYERFRLYQNPPTAEIFRALSPLLLKLYDAKNTNIEDKKVFMGFVVKILSDPALKHLHQAAFFCWKKMLEKTFSARYSEENFGFKGAFDIDWNNGLPKLKITGAKRYECAMASSDILTFLKEAGASAKLCLTDIKTVRADGHTISADDFGALSHYFVEAEMAGKRYFLGVTPLDRRVLRIYPVARIRSEEEDFLLEGDRRTAAPASSVPEIPFWNGNSLIPMEWFMHNRELVYLLAGLHVDGDLLLFLTSSIVFGEGYPQTRSFLVRTLKDKLIPFQSEISRARTAHDLYRIIRSSVRIADCELLPPDNEIYARGITLLKDIVLKLDIPA